jgi:hypothetical protein
MTTNCKSLVPSRRALLIISVALSASIATPVHAEEPLNGAPVWSLSEADMGCSGFASYETAARVFDEYPTAHIDASAIACSAEPSSQVSHSSGVVKSTGIALAWIGRTMSFDAVVRNAKS